MGAQRGLGAGVVGMVSRKRRWGINGPLGHEGSREIPNGESCSWSVVSHVPPLPTRPAQVQRQSPCDDNTSPPRCRGERSGITLRGECSHSHDGAQAQRKGTAHGHSAQSQHTGTHTQVPMPGLMSNTTAHRHSAQAQRTTTAGHSHDGTVDARSKAYVPQDRVVPLDVGFLQQPAAAAWSHGTSHQYT